MTKKGKGVAFFQNKKWYVNPVHSGALDKMLVTSGAPNGYEAEFWCYYETQDNTTAKIVRG